MKGAVLLCDVNLNVQSKQEFSGELIAATLSADVHEKYGDIILLSPDGQTEIARVHLYNLGISGIERGGGGAAEPVRTVTARLYCERMALEWKAGAASPAMNVRIFSR